MVFAITKLSGLARNGHDVDIAAWLDGLGLSQYEAAFRDNDVDLTLLPSLTSDDLRDLGIASVGHRRRLLAAIAALHQLPGPLKVDLVGFCGRLGLRPLRVLCGDQRDQEQASKHQPRQAFHCSSPICVGWVKAAAAADPRGRLPPWNCTCIAAWVCARGLA